MAVKTLYARLLTVKRWGAEAVEECAAAVTWMSSSLLTAAPRVLALDFYFRVDSRSEAIVCWVRSSNSNLASLAASAEGPFGFLVGSSQGSVR